MKVLFFFTVLLLSFLSCKNESTQKVEAQESVSAPVFSKVDFQKIFTDNNIKGAFLLYDLKHDTTLVFNEPRTKIDYLPASTFKIINSLIALETRVIKDEKEMIAWDGEKRFVNEWNRDQNLQSAFKYSVVWFYQELARRIGEDRMQHYIDIVAYGNQNIGGGIDRFWLEGNIRITMQQQIDFLKRIHQNDLPFSQQTIDIVKEIMIHKKTEDYVLRAKTGWAARVKPNIGWFVGYLERKDNVYFFATNIDILENQDSKFRKKITLQILDQLNLLKPSQ